MRLIRNSEQNVGLVDGWVMGAPKTVMTTRAPAMLKKRTSADIWRSLYPIA